MDELWTRPPPVFTFGLSALPALLSAPPALMPISGPFQMCLWPGPGCVVCAAGDLPAQLRSPGTNEKNKSLEREIIFKGSALT